MSNRHENGSRSGLGNEYDEETGVRRHLARVGNCLGNPHASVCVNLIKSVVILPRSSWWKLWNKLSNVSVIAKVFGTFK